MDVHSILISSRMTFCVSNLKFSYLISIFFEKFVIFVSFFTDLDHNQVAQTKSTVCDVQIIAQNIYMSLLFTKTYIYYP